MPHILPEGTQVHLYQQSLHQRLHVSCLQKPPVLNQEQVYFYNTDLDVQKAVLVPDKKFHTCTEKSIVHKQKFYLFKSKSFLLIKSTF